MPAVPVPPPQQPDPADPVRYERRTDVARRVRVSVDTVEAWTRMGMPSIRVGGIRRFDPAAVDAWLAAHAVAAA